MPRWLRWLIDDALLDMLQAWTNLALWFWHIADDCRDIPLVGDSLYSLFEDVGDACADIQDWTNDLRGGWNDLCDWLDDLFDDLHSLASHVYGWLRDLVEDAWGAAQVAYAWAVEALARADDALAAAIAEAAAALSAAMSYAESLIQDIGAWILSHSVDVYNAIRGYIQDVADWFQQNVADVWAGLLGSAVELIESYMADIAAPINLVLQWFDEIQDFFTDPLEWLQERFTDWFLGREE